MAADRERVALTAFVAQAVLAGGNAVGIRFSNRELAPLWGAGLRLARRGSSPDRYGRVATGLPRGRALTGSLLYGLFNFGASFALIYYGLVQCPARDPGQTLLALVPLATLLLPVLGAEPPPARCGGGTLLALAGVAWMSRVPLRGAVPPLPSALSGRRGLLRAGTRPGPPVPWYLQ